MIQTVMWAKQRQEACPNLVRCWRWCPEAPLDGLGCWGGGTSGGFPRCAAGRPTSSLTSSLSGAFGWPALALFVLQGLLGDDIKANMLACRVQLLSHFSGVGSAAVAALLLHAGFWTLGLQSDSWNFSEPCEKSHMPKGFVEIV